ncbi:MAG TPA: Sua5/YciO/YrdC/YwlC family protein [Miltoncostaeaceae bacterium]|nr:Sua5/YciO/YrdC/YwlC family protein [Miltoncostaeaceae bacterium]
MIDAADVAAAGAALARGGLALLPTDTVYGLAASLDTPDGVSALYAAKGRPRSRPFQVLLYAPEGLEEALAPLPAPMAAAARALLPGPATCLLADPAGRYAAAAGEAPGSAGIRAPRVQGVLAPLAALDIPLVATSANEPGGRDPAALADVDAPIRRAVDVELDAGTLPGTASAVVDLRGLGEGAAAVLVRPGPDPAAVERALAALGVALRR